MLSSEDFRLPVTADCEKTQIIALDNRMYENSRDRYPYDLSW